MKKIYLLFAVLLGVCLQAMAQEIVTIKGKVVDEDNEPIIGATVVVKDMAGFGTTTDIEGNFSLRNVKTYQTLLFSYVGYKPKEVVVKDQKIIVVKMSVSEDNVLDELIVTGSGLRKKINMTGAVTNVDVNLLKTNSTSSLTNALAGVVPGIHAYASRGGRPGETSDFWIRSIETFGGGSNPLVLVDGFERDIDEVNVEDIESFTVLKDASETAIYGSRGANGVILITTKRGASGKINISVKAEGFYNQLTKLPEFVDGYTFASMANEARITRNETPLYTHEELEMFRLHLDPDLYPDVNWMDVMMRNGAFSKRASLSLSGGGTTARYYASVNYSNEEGLYKSDKVMKDYNTNANYRKWSYRLNLDLDITKTTLLKFGVSGSLSTRNDPGSGSSAIWNSIMGYNPTMIPIMYSNGMVPAYKIDTSTDSSGNVTVSDSGSGLNPWVLATQTGYSEIWNNTIQATVELQQKLDFITKGLDFQFRFGFDTYHTNTNTLRKWPTQYFATPRYRDTNGELVFTKIVDEKQMTQTTSNSGSRKEFLEWQLNYHRTFFKYHNVGAVVKYNQQADIKTQNVGSNIKNGLPKRYQGWAGRVDYNWRNRYYVNANFGYTASENFHKNHRWGFFPAFSGAWNISEESFVKELMPWLDMFKVRFSWGKTGSTGISDRFPFTYNIGSSGQSFQFADYGYDRKYSGNGITKVSSDDITWEVSTKNDLGIEFSVLNDKISGSVDYYTSRREGIYMSRNYLPYTTGLAIMGGNPKANVGVVEAKGVDGQLTVKHKIGKVDLTLRGNMTLGKNEIVEIDEAYNVYAYRLQKGHRVNQAMGFISLGLFKDWEDIRNSPYQGSDIMPGDIKYQDVNGDGVINNDDQVAIGSTTVPNLTYGFGISGKWNGLDVNLHFQGAGQSSFFINGSSVFAFDNVDTSRYNIVWGNVLSEFAYGDRWISHEISGTMETENPNASYPRLTYGANSNNRKQSTFWLRDGSYIRLKTLDIGYTLPKTVVNKLRLSNVRVFFVGTNLFTWSSFKLWDPEIASNDGKKYPLAKSYSLGISVNI